MLPTVVLVAPFLALLGDALGISFFYLQQVKSCRFQGVNVKSNKYCSKDNKSRFMIKMIFLK